VKSDEWKKEAAPLAYRVLPQDEEFFDSWLDRLAVQHEASRSYLFEFLGLEAKLARIDLAGSDDDHAREIAAPVVERLAWAVQCDASIIWATFIPATAECLLPRQSRQYGCAKCWLDRLATGKPALILREWVLRQSWHCRVHDALLVDLGGARRDDDGSIDIGRLRRLARGAARAFDMLEFSDAGMMANHHATRKLLGQGPLERPMAELDAYLDEFSENRLHLVAARTLLLANAHCHDRQMLRRFAAIFALPGCPGTKPPVFPSNGDVVTLQRLESAICKAHRYDLRRQYRKLGAVERRLGPFCSLASAAFNATDWHDSARQALEEECRRRRCRDDALESLHVARDYAERAEGACRPGLICEPFDPACWGFARPTVKQLDLVIAKLEAKRASDRDDIPPK
jgi:hypothetical protein